MARTYKSELIHRIYTKLQSSLIDDIDADDDARATRVVKGKDVEDPEGIVVSIHDDNPLGPTDDTIDQLLEGNSRFGWHFPPESIGGSRFSQIGGSIQVRAIQDGTTPAEALDILDTVQTRIEYALNNDGSNELTPFTDDYDFTVSNLVAIARKGYASGGEDVAVDAHWVYWFALVSQKRTN